MQGNSAFKLCRSWLKPAEFAGQNREVYQCRQGDRPPRWRWCKNVARRRGAGARTLPAAVVLVQERCPPPWRCRKNVARCRGAGARTLPAAVVLSQERCPLPWRWCKNVARRRGAVARDTGRPERRKRRHPCQLDTGHPWPVTLSYRPVSLALLYLCRL